MAADPTWKSLAVQVPATDVLERARGALEGLVVYLEVVKTILETVKVFNVDISNPIKPLVEAVLQIVLTAFETLRRSGGYAWFDVPDPLKDPNFNQWVGGYEAFTIRFAKGLRDPKDPNRPQPIAGATRSGFILIVADAESPPALLKYLDVMMRFFGKEFAKPRYPAPASFNIMPLGASGDPILALHRYVEEQPTKLLLEWTLPPVNSPGDPGFSGLIQSLSQTFIPPRFLIEKSKVDPRIGQVLEEDLGTAAATGPVILKVQSPLRERGKGEKQEQFVRVADDYGDPVLKFQEYIVVDALNETATFLLGQLGTFRYIDSDIEPNTVYYYRVRSYSGELKRTDASVVLEVGENTVEKIPVIRWPGDVVMGQGSPVEAAIVPTFPEKFNVFQVLKQLFQVAFALNFHLQVPKGVTFDATTGLPEGPDPETHYTDIGLGSLTEWAGPLTSFRAVPIVGPGVGNALAVTEQFQPSPVTGRLPDGPWNETPVVRNASRLAVMLSSAMLEGSMAIGFKGLMEGAFPRGVPQVAGLEAGSLLDVVEELTKISDPQKAGQAAVQTANVLYGSAFVSPEVRLNVLYAVNFCKGFSLGGGAANWIQVSVLRDIAPWSGQMIYELLGKMQALLDAYAGVSAELNAFIDSLVLKVDALEEFLAYLVSILDFVASLSLGFYFLSVPETEGDTSEWLRLIDSAKGNAPPSGPGGYTGGAAFAYVGTDVSAFAQAFKMLF